MNFITASIDAIDPAIVKLPVSRYDMINVIHIDNRRYDNDLYKCICSAFIVFLLSHMYL